MAWVTLRSDANWQARSSLFQPSKQTSNCDWLINERIITSTYHGKITALFVATIHHHPWMMESVMQKKSVPVKTPSFWPDKYRNSFNSLNIIYSWRDIIIFLSKEVCHLLKEYKNTQPFQSLPSGSEVSENAFR